MFSRLLPSLVVLVGLLLALTGASAAQTATPPPPAAATPLPAEPTVNGFTIPRHVIYIGMQPGERNDLIIEGYKSVDPLGQGLYYAFDFDGDGRFTEFGFPSAGSAPVDRAGPFTPALRVRDQAGRVAEQRFDMVARQFSAGYVDAGRQTWASLAAVGGRPALAYYDEDAGLKFAINSQADGGGARALSSQSTARPTAAAHGPRALRWPRPTFAAPVRSRFCWATRLSPTPTLAQRARRC